MVDSDTTHRDRSFTSQSLNTSDCFNEWSRDELLDSIHRSIDWLQRLSNSIRRTSSNNQNAKAELFKIEDHAEHRSTTESEVRRRYGEIIHEISPGLQDDWMIDRLVDTMIIRLKRVLYRRSRHVKWSFPRVEPPSLQETPSTRLAQGYQPIQPGASSQSGTNEYKFPAVGHEVRSSGNSATTFNQSEWKRNTMYKGSEISTATSTSKSSAHDLDVPSPPADATTGEEFICPYCRLVLKSHIGTPRAWR